MIQAKYKALKQEATAVDDLEDVEKSSVVHPIVHKRFYLTWLMGFMLVVSLLSNVLHYVPPSSWADKRQYNKTYSKQKLLQHRVPELTQCHSQLSE